MSWFDDNLVIVVGDGTKSLFWIVHWLKGYVLMASLEGCMIYQKTNR